MFRTVFNGAAIVSSLRDAQARLSNMTPVYEDIGELLIDRTKSRFRTGTAPDGSAWAPKRPATLERYRRAGDGLLPHPLIGPSKRLGNEIAKLANADGVEVGSNLEYSGVMQGGAAKGAFGADGRGRPIPWGNIPARVWLGISDQDERDILDIVDEHLQGALAT
ncbi:MAG: phage virion morphogenesis protein [Pseudomonadota bacterium]